MIVIVFCSAEDPSHEFISLRDLVSLELCYKYLNKLFSKQSILETTCITKEMIDKTQEIYKLTEVIFDN